MNRLWQIGGLPVGSIRKRSVFTELPVRLPVLLERVGAIRLVYHVISKGGSSRLDLVAVLEHFLFARLPVYQKAVLGIRLNDRMVITVFANEKMLPRRLRVDDLYLARRVATGGERPIPELKYFPSCSPAVMIRQAHPPNVTTLT